MGQKRRQEDRTTVSSRPVRRVALSTTTPSASERFKGLKHLVSLGSDLETSRGRWVAGNECFCRSSVCVYSSSKPSRGCGSPELRVQSKRRRSRTDLGTGPSPAISAGFCPVRWHALDPMLFTGNPKLPKEKTSSAQYSMVWLLAAVWEEKTRKDPGRTLIDVFLSGGPIIIIHLGQRGQASRQVRLNFFLFQASFQIPFILSGGQTLTSEFKDWLVCNISLCDTWLRGLGDNESVLDLFCSKWVSNDRRLQALLSATD